MSCVCLDRLSLMNLYQDVCERLSEMLRCEGRQQQQQRYQFVKRNIWSLLYFNKQLLNSSIECLVHAVKEKRHFLFSLPTWSTAFYFITCSQSQRAGKTSANDTEHNTKKTLKQLVCKHLSHVRWIFISDGVCWTMKRLRWSRVTRFTAEIKVDAEEYNSSFKDNVVIMC